MNCALFSLLGLHLLHLNQLISGGIATPQWLLVLVAASVNNAEWTTVIVHFLKYCTVIFTLDGLTVNVTQPFNCVRKSGVTLQSHPIPVPPKPGLNRASGGL